MERLIWLIEHLNLTSPFRSLNLALVACVWLNISFSHRFTTLVFVISGHHYTSNVTMTLFDNHRCGTVDNQV